MMWTDLLKTASFIIIFYHLLIFAHDEEDLMQKLYNSKNEVLA